jgi:hypothetical protein
MALRRGWVAQASAWLPQMTDARRRSCGPTGSGAEDAGQVTFLPSEAALWNSAERRHEGTKVLTFGIHAPEGFGQSRRLKCRVASTDALDGTGLY